MSFAAIAAFLSSLRVEFGAPLANHLWQSTLFVGLVWLLTLLLRKNRAQTRYLLWLVASAKFVVPFSLLIGLGSHIAWTKARATPPSLFIVTQVLSEPFDTVNPAPIVPPCSRPAIDRSASVPASSPRDRVALRLRDSALLLVEAAATPDGGDAEGFTRANWA
jgi:hypothetical protein